MLIFGVTYVYWERCLTSALAHPPAAQNAISATHKAGIRTLVVTSSFASIADPTDAQWPLNGRTFSESDWNPATYEEAARSDNAAFGYATSKKVAEEAVWSYQKEQQLDGELNIATICPTMIFGPFIHVTQARELGESVGQVRDLFTGKAGDPVPPTSFPTYCDVRDVALAHVLAAEASCNGRFCVMNSTYDNQWIIDFAHNRFPERARQYELSEGSPGQYIFDDSRLYKIDVSKSQKVLGLEYQRTREETFSDMIDAIYESV